jgi:hypothetical protein
MRWLALLGVLLTVGCSDVEFPMAPTRAVPSWYTLPAPSEPERVDRSNPQPCTNDPSCRRPGNPAF